jgi:hypothetical protein
MFLLRIEKKNLYTYIIYIYIHTHGTTKIQEVLYQLRINSISLVTEMPNISCSSHTLSRFYS